MDETVEWQWQRLVRKTRRSTLLYGLPTEQSTPDGVEFRHGRLRWFAGGLMVVLLAAAVLVLAYLTGRNEDTDWIGHAVEVVVPVALGGMALLALFGLLSMLLRRTWVLVDVGRRELVICWGWVTAVRRLRLSRSQVRLELRIEQEDRQTGMGAKGSTVIFLSATDLPGEIRVAAGMAKAHVEPVYRRLCRALGVESADQTFAELNVGEEEPLLIPMEPVRAGDWSLPSMRVAFPSPDVAVVVPTVWSRLLFLPFVILGLIGLLVVVPHTGESLLFNVVLAALCSCFTLVGVIGVLGRMSGRIVRADRSTGLVSVRDMSFPVARWVSYPLEQLAAVQVCAYYSGGDGPYTAYELNVVLREPPAHRINVACHADGERLRDDAARLAEFLDLPLLDHA